MKHTIFLLASLLFATSANADKLRPVPVKTVGETYFCKTYEMLVLRQQMIDRRDRDSREGFETTFGPFGGHCGYIGNNKWMFYTGISQDANYVALRFAIDGSDVWVSKDSVGPIPTIVPGRSLKQANKGTGCKEWEPIAKAAYERREKEGTDLMMRSRQQSFMAGVIERAAGINDSIGVCESFYRQLVYYNQERVALLNCPKLSTPARKEKLDKDLDATEWLLTERCIKSR